MHLPGRATARLRPTMRRRAAGLLAAAVALPTALALAVPGAAVAAPAPVAQQAAAAPTIQSVQWVTDRQVALTIDSPAMGVPITVGVLLPRTWNSDLGRTYPAFMLLDGFRVPDNSSDWFNMTDIEEFFKDKDALVVTAYGGEGSFYQNWRTTDPNSGPQGTMQWYDFWNTEVPQVLSQGFRFNGNKAVGGLSMGGTAAFQYAFKNPGAWKAAASYSGYLHTTAPFYPQILQYSISSNTRFNPDNLWGDPATSPLWPQNDPFVNAEQLRGVSLYASAGDGSPGFADTPGLFGLSSSFLGSLLEILARYDSVSLTDRLGAIGIPVTTDYYVGGTHSWPYWQRELKDSWPQVARALGIPASGTDGCVTDGRLAAAAAADGIGRCTTNVYAVTGGIAQDFFGGRAFLADGSATPGSLKGSNGAKFQELGGTGGDRTNPLATSRFSAPPGTPLLGLPVSSEIPVRGGDGTPGVYTEFSQNKGHIYFSPATGSHQIGGAIFDKWGTLGFETGELGFPSTDELVPLGQPAARYNGFQGGQVLFSVPTQAHEVKGAILAAWLAQPGTGTGSAYGLPTTDEFAVPGGLRQNFQGGYFVFTFATGQVTAFPNVGARSADEGAPAETTTTEPAPTTTTEPAPTTTTEPAPAP